MRNRIEREVCNQCPIWCMKDFFWETYAEGTQNRRLPGTENATAEEISEILLARRKQLESDYPDCPKPKLS